MPDTARERLGALLAGADTAGVFCASRTAPTGDLHLEVVGLGLLALPVPEEQAGRLCEIGRPARYGRGEQTLLDRAVRDTWEIPKSRVKIDKRRWDKTLVPVLDALRADLGFPSGCMLEARFHSMLVYAPGQFFVQHQDSEKDDTMVASLVVTLPSSFTGGVLEVEHGGQVASFRGSKKHSSFVAFYGDCRHQIKPVKRGHRVVMTYDLLLRRPASSVPGMDVDPEALDGTARCLEEHFGAPGALYRLVYLLDHEYTSRSLSWSRLKGADIGRAMLLQAAAERAGCETVLALADIHETWSAFEPERPRSWHRYGRDRWWEDADDDFDDERAGGEDYQLDELIEFEVTLDSWLASPDGTVAQVHLPVGGHEVCETSPSGDLRPYASEYEGYMGNWGNTLDRWYHRGALVVWPRRQAFAVRAEADPSWALDALAARIRHRELAGAREDAGTLAPLWEQAASRVEGTGFFSKALRTARALDDPALATMLALPFRRELLTTSHAKTLSALVEHYGVQWAQELLASWAARRRRYGPIGLTSPGWISSLPRLCGALHERGDPGTAVAVLLLEESWRTVSEEVTQASDLPWPSRRREALAELTGPIAALLEAATGLGATQVRDEVVGLLGCDDPDLVGFAIGVLRTYRRAPWNQVGLDVVAAQCRSALEARIASPTREEDDWSVQLPEGCSCELCRVLAEFLADPDSRIRQWPLAKDRRAHVHARIDAAELPVAHQTSRAGRPYTLVLTKTDAIFEHERQARRRDADDLAWLIPRA